MLHRYPLFLMIVSITLVVAGISASVFFWLIPPVIIRAYHGESLAVLNALIRGQAVHPVEEYLHAWRIIAWAILVGEAALGGILVILTWSPFQRFVDARLGPAPGRTGMSAGRLATVSAIIVIVVGTQLLDIALQTDHWPFSYYPMYAGLQSNTMWSFRVAGVTRDGEFWLVPDKQLRPLDSGRIKYAFRNLLRDNSEAAVGPVLQNIHKLYEAGRRSGAHGGPPLQALRLYRLQWRLDPSLSNKDTPELRRLYEIRVTD